MPASAAGNELLDTLASGFQTLSSLTEVMMTQQECTINDSLEQLWLKVHACLPLYQDS